MLASKDQCLKAFPQGSSGHQIPYADNVAQIVEILRTYNHTFPRQNSWVPRAPTGGLKDRQQIIHVRRRVKDKGKQLTAFGRLRDLPPSRDNQPTPKLVITPKSLARSVCIRIHEDYIKQHTKRPCRVISIRPEE